MKQRAKKTGGCRFPWVALLAGVGIFSQAPAARALESPIRSEEAEQIVHLLEYVGADYGGAVSSGRVTSPAEFEEQLEVLAEAGRVAARLGTRPTPRGFQPAAVVERVRTLVLGHRPEAEVVASVKEARAEFAAFFDLAEGPREPPSRDRGKELFEVHCASCHGSQGRADTARAAEYTPRPANFHDPQIAGALSPLRVFTTMRFGVPKTSMAPFDFLSDKERWDVAFYVSELDHGEASALSDEGRMYSLAELASHSDDELRDGLRSAGVREGAVEPTLANLRRRAPYDPSTVSPRGAALRVLRAQAGLGKIDRWVVRGDVEGAKTALLSVYLDEIEPLEAPLRAADPALVRDIELLFKELRADIVQRVPRKELERKVDTLSMALGRAGQLLAHRNDRPSFFATAISSAGIALREGAEAALLIAALLAVVTRAGSPERKRWIHAGWIAAAGAGGLTWVASRRVVEMSGLGRETLEGASALLAAAVLFYVSYWLFAKREAARWIAYLKTKATTGRAAATLLGISFLAVYREAFETVIFYQALVAEPGAGPAAGIGALVGVALLVLLVFAYGRAGKFAPPKSFFAFSSILLYGLSVVFAGQGIAALQTTGLLPLHPARLPHLPALGVYPTIETYAVQATLIALAVAAWWMLRAPRARATLRPPSDPPQPGGNAIAGSSEGAKL